MDEEIGVAGRSPPSCRPSNAELVKDAGKVRMDEPQMWGKGIINDVKRTVGTHWLKVRWFLIVVVMLNIFTFLRDSTLYNGFDACRK